MQNHVHIICFDVPYPANYGGAIDVFHTIRCLHAQDVKIILHCFEYGNRTRAKELEPYCEKIHYYKRHTSVFNLLSSLPYNVASRISSELKVNLLKDNYPIIFEVLHTCYLLNDSDLKGRKKIYRHSNIEHVYFIELAKAERSILKKWYLQREAKKLQRFEKQIAYADAILSVSEADLQYFKKKYPKTPSYYLPSFHQFDELHCKPGKGNYVLYHGNLSVSENYRAAEWLIEHVFSKTSVPVTIAGLNPPAHLIKKAEAHVNISIKANCSETEMKQLIENAQLHCLYTEQGTGLKLKLLNVLFSGRFVMANPQMLVGTSLKDACIVCHSAEDYLDAITKYANRELTQSDIERRGKIVDPMNNSYKTQQLIDLLF